MKTRIAALGATLALSAVLFGCGGSDDTNSGERPSAEDISAAFADQIPSDIEGADAYITCVGVELEASELPNGVLRSLAAGEAETSIDASNEEKYDNIINDVVTTCQAEAIGG